jgi:hypothetical protein
MNALKAGYKTAFADGNAEQMADAQAQMAVLGGEVAQLRAGKQALEARKQTRDTSPQPQQQPSIEEQNEAFIQRQPPLVRDWLRDHPNYFTDQTFKNEVMAVAQYATVRKGLQPDSREYIDFVNAELGIGQPRDRETPTREDGNADNRTQPSGREVTQNNGQQPPRQDNTSRRMVAAPAGGSVPGARSGGGDQVYLSAAEKAFVATLRDHEGKPVSEVEYAREKLALQRENEIGPNARSR